MLLMTGFEIEATVETDHPFPVNATNPFPRRKRSEALFRF
jgi:hypothetical protein